MRLHDKDMARLLKMFSFCSEREIETIIQQQLAKPKPWRLQRKLAEEMTLLVHGKEGLEAANRITKAFFSKDLNQLGQLSISEINDLFEGADEFQLEFVPGQISMIDLAMKTNCFKTSCKFDSLFVNLNFY